MRPGGGFAGRTRSLFTPQFGVQSNVGVVPLETVTVSGPSHGVTLAVRDRSALHEPTAAPIRQVTMTFNQGDVMGILEHADTMPNPADGPDVTVGRRGSRPNEDAAIE